MENKEFGSYFFPTGKSQGILSLRRETILRQGQYFDCIIAKSMILFTYFEKKSPLPWAYVKIIVTFTIFTSIFTLLVCAS